MFNILLLSLLLSPSFAGTLGVVKKDYQFESAPEYQTILAELKLLGTFAAKEVPQPKQMTRGEQVVAEAKARNKALIAAQNKAQVKDSTLSEWDKIKQEDQKTRDGWKQQVIDQRKLWQREQEIFLGRLKVYKENTFEIPVPKEVIVEKKTLPAMPDVLIVNEAFTPPIKDQAARATCSAFAGIRAIEILLSQNNLNRDLSEQYLYWASKPDCQASPCEQRGSWVTNAYRLSQTKMTVDIPTETNCAYETVTKEKNETQLPLSTLCHQGSAKVEIFEEVRTLAEVIEHLKNHTPVVVAAKLSENFYKNSGLVTLKDSEKKTNNKLDSHSLGHAFLAVGFMELPQEIKKTEGEYCLVVANSWGKGWGAGGYSCLTEKWMTKFRQPAPFIAVTKVSSI